MRTSFRLLTCLGAGVSTTAFARGGGGGAFAGALEWLLTAAVVGGAMAGAMCARCYCRRISWYCFGSLVVLPSVVALLFPHALFFTLPLLVFLAVFASTAYIAQIGLFQPRCVTPPTSGKITQLTGISYVLRWIVVTYLFWTVVSLVNFELLGFLATPWVALVFPLMNNAFLPFIITPLVLAVVVGCIVTAFVVKWMLTNRYATPFIFNGCVFLVFLIGADIYRYHLMSKSLFDHKPEQLECSTFLSSVLNYRHYFRGPHASFNENGKTYRWSYSERKFFQVK
jgi:hypothetical protein